MADDPKKPPPKERVLLLNDDGIAGMGMRPGAQPSRGETVRETLERITRDPDPPSPPDTHKEGERPGTKTLDYIGLGLLLAPPEVVVAMYIASDFIHWPRVIVATIACWITGGLIVWASHRWQSWRSGNRRVLPYLIAAENRFWGKALIVAASIGFALALSSLLSTKIPTNPTTPVGPPVTSQAPPAAHVQEPAPPLPPARFYPRAEKERIGAPLAKIRLLLNREGNALAQEAVHIGEVEPTAAKSAFEYSLERLRNGEHQADLIYRGIWQEIVNNNEYSDLSKDFQSLVGNGERVQELKNKIVIRKRAINAIISSFDKMNRDDRVNIADEMNRATEPLVLEVQKFGQWIKDSTKRVDDFNQRLAQ